MHVSNLSLSCQSINDDAPRRIPLCRLMWLLSPKAEEQTRPHNKRIPADLLLGARCSIGDCKHVLLPSYQSVAVQTPCCKLHTICLGRWPVPPAWRNESCVYFKAT